MEGGSDERLNFELDCDSDHDIIEALAGDLHCPLCGSTYDPAETQLVREHGGSLTLAVQCHRCSTGSLIRCSFPSRSLPSSTELTPVERAFFAYLSPLNDADVRRIHQLLREHRGDLRDLI